MRALTVILALLCSTEVHAQSCLILGLRSGENSVDTAVEVIAGRPAWQARLSRASGGIGYGLAATRLRFTTDDYGAYLTPSQADGSMSQVEALLSLPFASDCANFGLSHATGIVRDTTGELRFSATLLRLGVTWLFDVLRADPLITLFASPELRAGIIRRDCDARQFTVYQNGEPYPTQYFNCHGNGAAEGFAYGSVEFGVNARFGHFYAAGSVRFSSEEPLTHAMQQGEHGRKVMGVRFGVVF